MFAQVIQGRTTDPAGLRAAMDRWMRELQPGSVGWLGSTGGVTDDGQVVVVARFESADAARRNSERPEQGAWWEETQRLFDGEVTFLDSEAVEVDLRGEPDRAGFVQVMQGQVTDPDRARKVVEEMSTDEMARFRPDVVGSVMIAHDEGRWTQVVYFTSEAEAREGERKAPPPEMQAAMEELAQIGAGEVTYFDLREPLMHSPG
ncbi:hypothetical protein ACI8AF_14885 [Blastococcus sp. SYSU D00669]